METWKRLERRATDEFTSRCYETTRDVTEGQAVVDFEIRV